MKKNPTSIEVVAVALIDPKGQVLMQRRRLERAHGGLWEFPGGKVEAGETPEIALIREIREELDVAISAEDLAYLDRAEDPASGLVISLYTCCRWQGQIRCLDAQALVWRVPARLLDLEMPPLDVPLAQSLLRACI